MTFWRETKTTGIRFRIIASVCRSVRNRAFLDCSMRRFGFGSKGIAGRVCEEIRRIAVIVVVPLGGKKHRSEEGSFIGYGVGGNCVPVCETVWRTTVLFPRFGALALCPS